MARKPTGFRLDQQALQALDVLAEKAGKTRVQVLEWLIEREYRKRVETGQIPADKDLFDLLADVHESE